MTQEFLEGAALSSQGARLVAQARAAINGARPVLEASVTVSADLWTSLGAFLAVNTAADLAPARLRQCREVHARAEVGAAEFAAERLALAVEAEAVGTPESLAFAAALRWTLGEGEAPLFRTYVGEASRLPQR